MGTIRFLLAVAVLLVHSSPVFGVTLIPGFVAVRSFYILSGFLMALIITEKYNNSARPYYYFITNRILRIYPLYFIVIILTLLLSVLFGLLFGSYGKIQFYLDLYKLNPQTLPALGVVMLTNITLIGQDFINFFRIDSVSGKLVFSGLQGEKTLQYFLLIPIAWTVAVEFAFYLLAPFIVVKNKFIPILALIAAICLRIAMYYIWEVDGDFFIYRFAPTEIIWFILGIICYQLYGMKWFIDERYAMLMLLVLVAVMFSYIKLPGESTDIVIYLLIFLGTPALFLRFSRSAVDKYLGDLCYPIYISHCLILMIVDAHRFPKPFGKGVPVLILTLLFSILVNKYILIPLEQYRARRIKFNRAET